MIEETNAQPGAGEVLPAETTAQQPAPRNDAEAAQLEEAAKANKPAEPTEAEKAAKAEADKQADEKKRNRTRDYINRINAENAELRRKAAEYEAAQRTQQRPVQGQPQGQHQADRPPTLEDYNYDFAAFQKADREYTIEQAKRGLTQDQQQATTVQQQQESMRQYDQRIAAFADQHPDFFEAVGSIDPSFLTPELQAAIIGHEKGPEIAYHLANDDEALWSLASVQPKLLPQAVARLASRLGAAQSAQPNPAPASQQPAALQPKPISQAPAPVPTVGGRSPTETPQEKLTDDEWYARDRERRRKR